MEAARRLCRMFKTPKENRPGSEKLQRDGDAKGRINIFAQLF